MPHVTLLESCRTSGIAYRPKIERSPRHIPIPSPQDAAAVLYMPNPQRMYVSFRGTCTLQDVAHVLDVRPKELPFHQGMHVHHGFYRKFMSLEEHISLELQRQPSLEEVIFTGHSMGGSLALIACYFYHTRQLNKNLRCHTFGAPPTGNLAFFQYLTRHIREVHCVRLKNDVVPHIPLNPFFFHKENILDLEDEFSPPPWDVLQNHSCMTYYQVIQKHLVKEISM